LVFKTTDPSKCWDGKWKGLLQSSAAFVYWIKAKTPCSPEPFFRKGTVMLIR